MVQSDLRINIAAELTELRNRMTKPQRHRLLHGYPLAAAMLPRKRKPGQQDDISFDVESNRGLLVGVLPHPFCNPAVAGCGFCTFPHEKYSAPQASALVAAVTREIDQRLHAQPELGRRPITGLYFGGGTANLTPPEDFHRLCRKLALAFDLSRAEVTLEGVPVYFLHRQPLLMDILRQELPARHFRLSMGIQTFDHEQLRRMGQLAFGNEETFRQVVELAHARNFTISADMLFNLPGQSLDQMHHDVEQAIALGLDHLGLYHLVLFRGLGTAWSREETLLSSLPSNEEAARNWLALHEQLLERGFYQTTLTNFERRSFEGDPRRFIYEKCSFQPDRYDMLGFGPSAISFAADRDLYFADKVLNPDAPADYLAGVERGGGAHDRYFNYTMDGLKVFYLTRRLAALSTDRGSYRKLFGLDLGHDFERELLAMVREGLINVTPYKIVPTPRGMFYADSIAALLAWRHVAKSRRGPGKRPTVNDNGMGHM